MVGAERRNGYGFDWNGRVSSGEVPAVAKWLGRLVEARRTAEGVYEPEKGSQK